MNFLVADVSKRVQRPSYCAWAAGSSLTIMTARRLTVRALTRFLPHVACHCVL